MEPITSNNTPSNEGANAAAPAPAAPQVTIPEPAAAPQPMVFGQQQSAAVVTPAQQQPATFGQQPIAAPAEVAVAYSGDYESNPFKVSITGLMTVLKVNPMSAILIMLVMCLPILVGFAVFSLMMPTMPIVAILILTVGGALIFPIMIGAYSSLAASSMNDQSKKAGEMYGDAFKKLLPILVASILLGLIVIVGLILFIIPGIIFASWYSLTFIAMFDENLGALAAMKRSRELVKGHVMEIIGANFAGSLLSSSFSSGGGGLLSPVISMGPTLGRYQQLKELKAANAPKPKVHYLNYLVMLMIIPIIAIVAFVIMNPSSSTQDPYKLDSSSQYDTNTNLDTDTFPSSLDTNDTTNLDYEIPQ